MPTLPGYTMPTLSGNIVPTLLGYTIPPLLGYTMLTLLGYTVPTLLGYTVPTLLGYTMTTLPEYNIPVLPGHIIHIFIAMRYTPSSKVTKVVRTEADGSVGMNTALHRGTRRDGLAVQPLLPLRNSLGSVPCQIK